MRLTALLCLLPLPALADCPGEVIFACDIKAKRLEVCLTDSAAIYRFGKPGRPDLTIATDLADLAYQPWPGIGSSIWETVRFHNQDTDYEVWTSIDKLMDGNGPDPERTGGVTVTQGDATLAELSCTTPPEPWALDRLYEALEAAGRCYDPAGQIWGGCGGE